MNPDGYLYSQVWSILLMTSNNSINNLVHKRDNFGMVGSILVLAYRPPTECGEGLESQTMEAGVLGQIQTGTGDSTGTPPTDLAPTPAPGTSWALTHSQR